MSHHSAQILERFRNAVMRPLATFPATRPAVVPGVVTIGPWTSGAHGTTTPMRRRDPARVIPDA